MAVFVTISEMIRKDILVLITNKECCIMMTQSKKSKRKNNKQLVTSDLFTNTFIYKEEIT